MANNPAWFDENHYLTSKLAQLRAAGETKFQTIVDVKLAIEAAGYDTLTHFNVYSLAERTSPNQYFNATEYLNAKVEQLKVADPSVAWTADTVALAIHNAGLSLWQHFQQFGWNEGVNPSNSFDVNAYLTSKLAQLQATEPDAGWTEAKLKETLQGAGLDPVTHFNEYGKNEAGVAVSSATNPVPSDDRAGGETFMLTKGLDNYQGTSGNDTIIGSVDAAANVELNTLSALDIINGGAGTDTLKVSTTQTTAIPLNNLSNVEIVEVTGTAAVTVDTTATTGVTDLNIVAAGGAINADAGATTNVSVAMKAAGAAVDVDGGNNVTV